MTENIRARLSLDKTGLALVSAVIAWALVAQSLLEALKPGSKRRSDVLDSTDHASCTACEEDAIAARHCSIRNFVAHGYVVHRGRYKNAEPWRNILDVWLLKWPLIPIFVSIALICKSFFAISSSPYHILGYDQGYYLYCILGQEKYIKVKCKRFVCQNHKNRQK